MAIASSFTKYIKIHEKNKCRYFYEIVNKKG